MTDRERLEKIRRVIKLAEKWNRNSILPPQIIAGCTFHAVRRLAFDKNRVVYDEKGS